jgi:hypothetical protein
MQAFWKNNLNYFLIVLYVSFPLHNRRKKDSANLCSVITSPRLHLRS